VVDLTLWGRIGGGPWEAIQTLDETDLAGDSNYLTGVFDVALRPEMYLSVDTLPDGDDTNEWRTQSGLIVYSNDLVGTVLDSPLQTTNRMRIAYPTGIAPPDGWPVILWPDNAGLTASNFPLNGTDGTSYESATVPLFDYLNAGFAVASMTVTPSSNSHPDLAKFRDYTEPEYSDSGNPKAQKEVCWAVQYLREYGYSRHNIDPNRIVLGGRSGGAITACWAAWNKDFADPTSDIPMLRRSSKPNALITYALPTFWPAYDPAAIGGLWFENAASPGSLASSLTQVPAGQELAGSPIQWILRDDESIRDWAMLPSYHNFGESVTGLPHTFANNDPNDVWSYPAPTGNLTNSHDGWNHYMLAIYYKESLKRFGVQAANKRFNFGNESAPVTPLSTLAPDLTTAQGYTAAELEDQLIQVEADAIADQIRWFKEVGIPGPTGQALAPDITMSAWLETIG